MSRTAIKITAGVKKSERFPVSVKRKPGQPAGRPTKDNRLTVNEKAYADAVELAWTTIPAKLIQEQFLAADPGKILGGVVDALTPYQEFLAELTLFQVDQSGILVFNEIKREVAADWRTLEKATPSATALAMNFNTASPAATQYANMSAGNMIQDMVQSQVQSVRGVIGRAFNDGLTRQQTSRNLVQVLNDIPTPKGIRPGNYALGVVFGDATKGLTVRYANAVYNRAEKLIRQNPKMSVAELKRRSNSYGSKLRRSRARTIARTELMRASNQGRLQGMWQAADQGLVNPVAAKKQWVTSNFDVCPICVPLNGVTVGLKDSFGGPGQAPPAHPNCRCTIRMLPDPLTYGLPTSTGTGQAGSPLQFVRPTRPGMKIQDVPVKRVEPMQNEEYFFDNAEQFMDEANSLAAAAGPEQAGMWQFGDYEDYGLKVIAREQGFDSRPGVISNAEMAALESDPAQKILYRGIGSDNRQELDGFVDDFLVNTDLPYQPQGIYGSGTYTSDSLELAEEYSTRKLGINTSRTGSSDWSENQVLKMALDKDAKIIDVEDLSDLHRKSLVDPVTGKPWRSAAEEYQERADRLKNQWLRDNDVSLYGDNSDAPGFKAQSEWHLDISGALRKAGFNKEADHVTKLFNDGKIRSEVLLRDMNNSELKLIFDEDVFGFRLGPNNQIPDELSESGKAIFMNEKSFYNSDDRGKLLGWGDGIADLIPDPLDGSPGYAANLELSKRARAIQDLTSDQNRFAAIRGYDAVRIPDAQDDIDFFVLLNRSAVQVADPAG
tara:strand:- start:905 stop:3235 length:2331 start_codon:yes stop_codon:yes gene_type:complete